MDLLAGYQVESKCRQGWHGETQLKWTEVSEQECSVARASAVLGDRWTLLLLSDIFLGVRRFEEFQERLGISRTTLTSRLKLLEKHGVISRMRYQENPPRHEYRLTGKGHDLFPVLSTIINWGDKYYTDDNEPPILRRHINCATDVQPILCCPECHGEIDARSIEARRRPERKGVPDVRRGPVARGRK